MKTPLICFLFLSLLISSNTGAADLDALIADCNDCHGKDGISTNDDIPVIAGQSYIVLEDALIAFADKALPCAESEYRHGDTARPAITMCEISAKLSKDEIEALSKHYADLPFVAVEQAFDEALVSRGAKVHDRNCEKCHSEGGSLADDDAGILAGQWMPYLRTAIEQYMAEERPMSDKMAEKMKRVKEEDFEALLHFYASEGL